MLLRNFFLAIFNFLGRRLFKYEGSFQHNKEAFPLYKNEVSLFSNVSKWHYKYGLSKWQMGLTTPRAPQNQIQQINA